MTQLLDSQVMVTDCGITYEEMKERFKQHDALMDSFYEAKEGLFSTHPSQWIIWGKEGVMFASDCVEDVSEHMLEEHLNGEEVVVRFVSDEEVPFH